MTCHHTTSFGIKYQLVKSNKKNLSLQIKDGCLIARSPIRMSVKNIEDFINKKQNWITKHLIPAPKQEFNNGDDFFYLGQKYPLIWQDCDLYFDGKNFIGNGDKNSFIEFYKTEFKKIILQRLPLLAKQHNFKYNQVRVKTQKTRWGSCSAKNNLNFNGLLAGAPLQTIDSVIIHELCHTIHKNHGADFWNLVYEIMPDYKKCEIWLKNNTIISL